MRSVACLFLCGINHELVPELGILGTSAQIVANTKSAKARAHHPPQQGYLVQVSSTHLSGLPPVM